MAKIYLSSTYTDLKAYRESVYVALRQMRHDVIAMEDYVATDERPIEKCLADVADSDLYIGIFAWRYGFIPSEMNPEHKSITELEYRKATQEGKKCLIFILAQDAPWPPTAMDAVTGESNRGDLITVLRDEFVREKTVKFFRTPEELASSVSTSVSNWEKSWSPPAPSNTPPILKKEQQERIQREERLKALIIDHSSFMQSRLESFVGRELELADIGQFIKTLLPTGGYLTITGQAGQGKSSIIARLVHEYNPDEVAHHFIPFNPGPDHQASILRDLMAQLILKHDLGDYYVASESRPVLRDFFLKVLAVIAAKDKQEVIFIDGLDQLKEDTDGTRDLSFLPVNPPNGIVFILGTRPNDTLRPLELLKPHHTYQLPNLSRADFDRILQHRGVVLERGLADRFYHVMQENALYLDLVALELSIPGIINPEEIIKRIAADPHNLFSLSVDRLKHFPAEWREVLKPILGLLLAAREPLPELHIRSILHLEHDRVSDGLRRLGGLVSHDGLGGYALFHLKFYDYLREESDKPGKEYIFAQDEERGWHQRLIQWCEQGDIQNIWQDVTHQPAEQGRRMYARKHYITHLYYAHAWQKLFGVLDQGSYGKEKIRHDPTSTRAYIVDLDWGCRAAATEERGLLEGIQLLPNLWRYTLLRTSLITRAEQYPEEAFLAMLLSGEEDKAIGFAELITNLERKTSLLLLIAQYLVEQPNHKAKSVQVFTKVGEVISEIEGVERRSELFGLLP